jgi:hypothetical protein
MFIGALIEFCFPWVYREQLTDRPSTYLGLSIFAAGFGARVSMVSVLTNLVSADSRARLYALLSMIEEVTRLVGTPLIQNAWAQGIEWGGGLLGFPFCILAVSPPLGSLQASLLISSP